MKILLATGNSHKKEEVQQILSNHIIVTPGEMGITFDCEETGTTYFDNALLKAKYLKNHFDGPILADDSGLSVVAMDGAPGIYSARFGNSINGTINQNEKNSLILKHLKNKENRNAFFVCCLILMFDDYRIYSVQETVHGLISQQPKGSNGFGYDPIFFIPEENRTMAELTDNEKNAISHRGKAVKQIKQFF